jgi:lipoate-protein ligase B
MTISSEQKESWVLDLGRIRYEDAFELQRKLVAARLRDEIKDTFLLLEHFPVYTANRQETFKNILAPREVLAEQGIEVCWTDRGGDVTYHGPGQIVGYSIMDLKEQGRDLHAYIRSMEQMIIDTLADYGIASGRDAKHPGVWVGNSKICAIGIAVKSGWITMHGFALNVNPDMEHYRMIIACGIADKGVTTMKAQLGEEVGLQGVKDGLIKHYSVIYNRLPRSIKQEELPWS